MAYIRLFKSNIFLSRPWSLIALEFHYQMPEYRPILEGGHAELTCLAQSTCIKQRLLHMWNIRSSWKACIWQIIFFYNLLISEDLNPWF